jgi:hypothetical protein
MNVGVLSQPPARDAERFACKARNKIKLLLMLPEGQLVHIH